MQALIAGTGAESGEEEAGEQVGGYFSSDVERELGVEGAVGPSEEQGCDALLRVSHQRHYKQASEGSNYM